MNIPATLRVGDTWGWKDSLPDYPAPEWALTYALQRVGSPIAIATSPSGTDHSVAVTATTTAVYAAGEYGWVVYVEKGSDGSVERHTVASGAVMLLPALHAADATTDNRSKAQKMLDAIDAALLKIAASGTATISHNGKSIAYQKPEELRRLRGHYQRIVNREKGRTATTLYRFGRT